MPEQLAVSVNSPPTMGDIELVLRVHTGRGPDQSTVTLAGLPVPNELTPRTVYVMGPVTVDDAVHVFVVLVQLVHR